MRLATRNRIALLAALGLLAAGAPRSAVLAQSEVIITAPAVMATDAPAPPPAVHLVEPVTARAARTWVAMHRVVPLHFPEGTTLDAFLKEIRRATARDGEGGVSIFVDPSSLEEAEKTLASQLVIDLEGLPLHASLRLALAQLGLTSYVDRDGVLVIKSEGDEAVPAEPSRRLAEQVEALRREVANLREQIESGGRAARAIAPAPPSAPPAREEKAPDDKTPMKKAGLVRTGFGGAEEGPDLPRPAKVALAHRPSAAAAELWRRLGSPVTLRLPKATPLREALTALTEAAKGKELPPLPIYVDPIGLQEAERTMESMVRIELDEVPLSGALRLMLGQIGLTYRVEDEGFLFITSTDEAGGRAERDAVVLDDISMIRGSVDAIRRELGFSAAPTTAGAGGARP